MKPLAHRRIPDYTAAIAAMSALPDRLLAELAGAPAPRSAFDARSTAEDVTEGLDLSGRTIAITGCNSGLGFETMRVLARRGAHVIGIARGREKAEIACESVGGTTTPEALDLAEWDTVADCADRIRGMNTPLDALICNAGVVSVRERELVYGLEKHFAVNHLGHFILANRLAGEVLRAEQGRFVWVSSRSQSSAPDEGILFDDLAWETAAYGPNAAYGHSKLANALCSAELARRLSDTAATSNSLHPGVIITNAIRNMNPVVQWLARSLGRFFTKTVERGAATQTYLATHPSLAGVRGHYFVNCNPAKGSRHLRDQAMGRRLWEVSEELTRDYLPTPSVLS